MIFEGEKKKESYSSVTFIYHLRSTIYNGRIVLSRSLWHPWRVKRRTNVPSGIPSFHHCHLGRLVAEQLKEPTLRIYIPHNNSTPAAIPLKDLFCGGHYPIPSLIMLCCIVVLLIESNHSSRRDSPFVSHPPRRWRCLAGIMSHKNQ